MSPTVKTTLTKTLILVFFALTAFFVLPGGVSAEEKAVGAFTVTGGQQNTDYTYADNTLTVNTGAVLTIKNTDSTTSTEDKIVVAENVTANITLDGVKIDVSSDENSCAFAVKSVAKLNLTLAAGSTNSLTSGGICAGLNVPDGASLTIDSDSADPGSLTAQCTVTHSSPRGAGIGGGEGENCGKITINGGSVTAFSCDGSDEKNAFGAGIGGGFDGAGGEVTITGGTVLAHSRNSSDSNGTAFGAGIGGGYNGTNGTVTITGGTIEAYSNKGTGSAKGAGIGGGDGKAGGEVTIIGGTVSAYSNKGEGIAAGAGIGGGSGGAGATVTIAGGMVWAYSNGDIGAAQGAGIGGGFNGAGGEVTITGGTVSAYSRNSSNSNGTANGAGIGGGAYGAGETVTIAGGSVQAVGGAGAEDIGKGNGGTDSGTLTNGDVNSTVSLVTLTVNDGDNNPMAAKAINTLTAGSYTGDATADATAEKYGIKDMATDAEGKLYLYLPAGDPTEGGLAYATLKDDATNTLYAGSVTGTDGNRSAILAPIDGNIDMSAIGGNLYIWNDGYGIGSSSNLVTKIPYNGNYTLSGTTNNNTVTVMPGYDGGTDGQDGYKTITLNNLNIDVSSNDDGCAFALSGQSGNTSGASVNLMLAAGSANSLKSGFNCAGLAVPDGTSLTIDGSGEMTTSSMDKKEGEGTVYSRGAGIGGDYVNANNGDASSSSGAITINGGSVIAIGSEGAGIGGGYAVNGGDATSSSGAVIITGGSVTATSSLGAGVGGGCVESTGGNASSSGGAVTITGGSITATSSLGAGIGGGYVVTNKGNATSSGGAVTITGGSIDATGGTGAQKIGYGGVLQGSESNNQNPGTLTNGNSADVSLVTLTINGADSQPMATQAIDTLTAGSYKGAETPDATQNIYGIHDVTTDAGGKLYLYLPAEATSQAVSTGATLRGDTTPTLYAGSVTGTDGNRSATLAPFDGAINMSATNGNAYIWNDGFMYGTSADENAKILYSGNYTLSGGTAETAIKNTVTVMPGYNGETDGQDGYKTITLDGLNIDVSDNINSCAFTLNKKSGDISDASVNLMLAADSVNSLKSGLNCAGLNVPDGASLTVDSDNTNPGSLTAQSTDRRFVFSYGAGIGGGYNGNGGEVTINGGMVTACSNEGTKTAYGAGIGGGHGGAGGKVIINGGTVTAYSSSGATTAYGAGIGGGDKGGAGGSITINGGTVTAYSGKDTMKAYGAGIGGGYDGNGGEVTINGGRVTACSGKNATDAYGAGIGSGYRKGGETTVAINGGTVMACSGKNTTDAYGAGIGGGGEGAGETVIITGGSVKAIGGDGGENIGHGRWNSDSGTLKNGTGDDAKDIYLTTIQTAGISQATDVYPAGTPASYGLQDVQTDSAGKLYFYLPANDTSTPETYTTVSLKKGSENGALATGDLWVAANHGNTLQIGDEDTGADFDASALTYNKNAQEPALKRGKTTLAPSAIYYKDASDNWSDKNTNVNATGYSVIAQTPADINSVYGQKIVKTDYNINPVAPEVTWPTASLTYGQTLSQASLTGGSAKGVGGADLLPGEFVWENPDTNPAVADSGTTSYTLNFNPTDNPNYSSAQKADMTVSVNKANGTASVTMASWEYGQTPSDPVPVSATNGTENVSYQYKESTADDATYTSTKPTMPGHYTVRATFGATTNYNTVTATADFTIREGSYTGLTFEDKTIPYDGKPHSLTVAGTLPQGTTVTYAPQSVTDAGSHTITATISGEGYTTETLEATLTIEAATPAVTITPAAGQEILIGEPVTLNVAVAGISGETVTGNVTLNGETQALENGHAAFSYTPADHQAKTLTADYTPESKSNYTAASTSITLTAGKKTREPITLSDQTKTYGDPAYTLTPTGGSLQDGEAYSYTSDNTSVAEVDINGQVTINGAGAAHLTVSLPESSAYQSAQTVMTLTVEKAAITSVTFEDASFKADGQPHSIELTGELPQGATVAYENNTQTTPGIYKAKAMIDGGQNYQSLTLEATLTITEKLVNPYVPEKPETPDEVSDSIDKLPTPEDYDAMTPEEQEEVKDAVDTVVDSITDLPEEEQAQIPAEDIEKISDLYDKIYKITIHKDTSAAQGLPTHVDEADIQVYGAGMAAQALGGDVKITLTQDLPPDHATLAFTLELYVKRESDTDYQKVDLKTPIVIQFALPESVKADGLSIEHLNPDGSVKETLTPEIKERTLTFLTTSFSNFLFVEQKDPTPPTPTPTPVDPTPTTTVKPEGNGGETRAESVLKKETSLKNPATGQAVTVGQLGGTAAVLAALAVLTALAIGRKSKKH